MKTFNLKDKVLSETEIKQFLIELGIRIDLLEDIDLTDLKTKYLTKDRTIYTKEESNRTYIYISTSSFESNACLIVSEPEGIRICEANYNRIGNGVNQEGTLYTRVVNKYPTCTYVSSCAVSLSKVNERLAKLTYFGDMDRREYSFSISVDPISLDGIGENIKVTNTLKAFRILDLFQKSHLKGKNMIKGKLVTASNEDVKDFEETHVFRFGGK